MRSVRRRQLMGSANLESVTIDRPDYWRIDFETTQDNQTVTFGDDNHVALSNPETKNIYLDGTKIYRSKASSITVPKAGNHIVYININQPYTNNANAFGIISSSLQPSYVRVPIGWKTSVYIATSGVIPIVDLLTPRIDLNKGVYTTFRIETLRVSNDIDISKIPASLYNAAEKIVKVKYKFIS